MGVWGRVHGLTVDIHPGNHTTPLLVSSWIPLISAAILSSIECKLHVLVTTLPFSPLCLSPSNSLSTEPGY